MKIAFRRIGHILVIEVQNYIFVYKNLDVFSSKLLRIEFIFFITIFFFKKFVAKTGNDAFLQLVKQNLHKNIFTLDLFRVQNAPLKETRVWLESMGITTFKIPNVTR
jgi:hypothetical protein